MHSREYVRRDKPVQLSEENAYRVMQKIEGLIAYVSKACFLCRRVDVSTINDVAQRLSSAIGLTCSRIFGSMDLSEEELDLICLEDPEVRRLAVELERLVGEERGRISKRCSLANILK